MVNYLGKFVPRLSETLVPIYNLLKNKNDFIWSADCEKAFKSVLKMLKTKISKCCEKHIIIKQIKKTADYLKIIDFTVS